MNRISLIVMLIVAAVAGCQLTPTESVQGAITPLGALIDRMGRPEVTNFIVRVPAERDLYNLEDRFAVSPTTRPKFAALLRAGLVALDKLDGQKDWTFYAPAIDPLVNLLMDDLLLVDPTKPCTVDTQGYLDVEKAILEDRAYETCGGRTPNADAIDGMFSYFVAHDREHIGDGVDAPASPATDVFPYLAEGHAPPAPAQ